MYQFFVESNQVTEGQIEITGNDVNHIKNVLRMKTGTQVRISEAQGADYFCQIEEVGPKRVLARILYQEREARELPVNIVLFQGLPKGDKMEFIIQKAVELGVSEIVPVAMRNCVVKLDEKKAASRILRWQGISESAAKQSRRAIVPEVTKVSDFSSAVKWASRMAVKLIPYELAEDMTRTRQILGRLEPGQDVAVFIGPEGGFTEEEVRLASENGIEPVTLGKRILRTETAGLTVLSWIMYLLEG